MKRLLACLFICVMTLVSAAAETITIDLSTATDEELLTVIELINTELASRKNTMSSNEIPPLSKGDIFQFGVYEQDANTENGFEPIDWIVLDEDDETYLVISRFVLDVRCYNPADMKPVTWETSEIRAWLNSDFLNMAFSSNERDRIVLYHIVDTSELPYDAIYGNMTDDYVFLLSLAEFEMYFPGKGSGMVVPTAYANSIHESYNGYSQWWLRTPGNDPYRAIQVTNSGGIYTYPGVSNAMGIRPAMRIKKH